MAGLVAVGDRRALPRRAAGARDRLRAGVDLDDFLTLVARADLSPALDLSRSGDHSQSMVPLQPLAAIRPQNATLGLIRVVELLLAGRSYLRRPRTCPRDAVWTSADAGHHARRPREPAGRIARLPGSAVDSAIRDCHEPGRRVGLRIILLRSLNRERVEFSVVKRSCPVSVAFPGDACARWNCQTATARDWFRHSPKRHRASSRRDQNSCLR